MCNGLGMGLIPFPQRWQVTLDKRAEVRVGLCLVCSIDGRLWPKWGCAHKCLKQKNSMSCFP
jgi:hypothetical protein